jgi:hypothetical protein
LKTVMSIPAIFMASSMIFPIVMLLMGMLPFRESISGEYVSLL